MYSFLALRRAIQIDRLHAYAAAGRFPHNSDFPGRRVPYFVDRAGTRCAVGELVHHDGRDDIVSGVAASDNHVLVSDVDGGPLLDWISTSGLIQEEAARIQPAYRDPTTAEQAELETHFETVERELVENFDSSLGAALQTLIEREFQTGAPPPALSPPNLVSALGSTQPQVRAAAACSLAKVELTRADRERAGPMLRGALTDPDERVRICAAVTVDRLAATDDLVARRSALEITIPILVAATQSPQTDRRRLAVIELGLVAPLTGYGASVMEVGRIASHALLAAKDDPASAVAQEARVVCATERYSNWEATIAAEP